MVPPSYFSHGYLSHAKWVALWQQSLRVDYQPVIHVSGEWFLELTRQLHKTRAIAIGGVLRHYMRELEEKNQDLIDESEQTHEVDEGILSFRWERKSKKYNTE